MLGLSNKSQGVNGSIRLDKEIIRVFVLALFLGYDLIFGYAMDAMVWCGKQHDIRCVKKRTGNRSIASLS